MDGTYNNASLHNISLNLKTTFMLNDTMSLLLRIPVRGNKTVLVLIRITPFVRKVVKSRINKTLH